MKIFYSKFRLDYVRTILIIQQRLRHDGTHVPKTKLHGVKYCMNLVEKNDYENYLCTLLLSKEYRRHAFAIRAFNVEVSRSSKNPSDGSIAEMRLKFWLDSVEKCYGDEKSYIADQPVLKELKNTIDSINLNKIYLKRLVISRARSPNEPFVTLKDIETYAEQTYSTLFYLLVELTGIKDVNVDHVASHLGKAQGIVTLLRAIPYTKRGHTLYIPQEILIKHGVSQERVLRANIDDKGVEDCVFEVATAAYQHLEHAQNLFNKLPKVVHNIFLPFVAVERYLERLRRSNFRLVHQSCLQRDSLLPLALYMRSLKFKNVANLFTKQPY